MRLVSEYTSRWRKQSFSFIPKANNSVWSGHEISTFGSRIQHVCYYRTPSLFPYVFLWSIFLERKRLWLSDFCVTIYRRFHSSITADQKWLRERSHESYAKNYSMVFPHDEPLASRNMRCDPFHKVKHLYQISVLSSNKVRIKWCNLFLVVPRWYKMHYWPSVKASWLDIGHISSSFLVFLWSCCNCTKALKGPCSPKWLCVLVFLFWNTFFVKFSVLIG